MIRNGAAVAKSLQQKPANSAEQLVVPASRLRIQQAWHLKLSAVFGRFLARRFDFNPIRP
jgi:hypothetical protein